MLLICIWCKTYSNKNDIYFEQMYGWKFIINSSAEIFSVANFGILSFSYSVNI